MLITAPRTTRHSPRKFRQSIRSINELVGVICMQSGVLRLFDGQLNEYAQGSKERDPVPKHFRVSSGLSLRLAEFGISIPAVLREAGLPKDLFEQKRVLVSTDQLFGLWRAIGTVSSDPLIGLKLGAETRTERLPPVGIAALATENFVAAVKHMARYKKLTAPEEILHELNEHELSVAFRWLRAGNAEPQVLTDCCFSLMVTIARHGTGNRKLTPLRVEYLQPRTNLPAIGRHFGCEVICGASQNKIIFRSTDATASFVTRNAELLELLAPQFEEQLRRLGEEDTPEDNFVELVRRTIQHRLTGHRPSIEMIAQALHLSSRTIQRRLQDAGYSFQRVLDEARHQMARYYLSNSVLELNETAYLLGFENPNSFGRAFRGWEGMPPSDWREVHRTSTASVLKN